MALCRLMLFRRFVKPGVVMVRFCILGCGLGPLFGIWSSVSVVNTEWNLLFKMLALSVVRLPSVFSAAIPDLSVRIHLYILYIGIAFLILLGWKMVDRVRLLVNHSIILSIYFQYTSLCSFYTLAFMSLYLFAYLLSLLFFYILYPCYLLTFLMEWCLTT